MAPSVGTALFAARGESTSSKSGTGSPRRSCSPPSGQSPRLAVTRTPSPGDGVLVTANRGDCPLGGLQDRLGDPVPLFELVLSPRAAKRAVPTLGAITAAGLVLVAVRGPHDVR